jgi:TolB-like protein
VISGSLRCAGPALRVFAELSDARNNTQLWAQSYDRSNEDLHVIMIEMIELESRSFDRDAMALARGERSRF